MFRFVIINSTHSLCRSHNRIESTRKKHSKDFITCGNQNCQNINYHYARQTNKRGGTTASNAHWAFVSWEWSIHVNAHRRRTKKTSSIGVYAHFRLDACYSYLFYFQSFFFRKLMCSNVVFFVFHLVFNEHFAKLWDISANGNEMSKWTN